MNSVRKVESPGFMPGQEAEHLHSRIWRADEEYPGEASLPSWPRVQVDLYITHSLDMG